MKLNVEIDLNKQPDDVDVLHYVVLTMCVLDKGTVEAFLNDVETTEEDILVLSEILNQLQTLMYIKLVSSEEWTSIELRKKATDLFPENKGASFDEFWEKYHEIIKEWRKTAKYAAEKHWKRMTSKERNLAIENIQDYYDSAAVIKGRKVVHMARTYLSDKLYNDEFGTNESEDWTKNHV